MGASIRGERGFPRLPALAHGYRPGAQARNASGPWHPRAGHAGLRRDQPPDRGHLSGAAGAGLARGLRSRDGGARQVGELSALHRQLHAWGGRAHFAAATACGHAPQRRGRRRDAAGGLRSGAAAASHRRGRRLVRGGDTGTLGRGDRHSRDWDVGRPRDASQLAPARAPRAHPLHDAVSRRTDQRAEPAARDRSHAPDLRVQLHRAGVGVTRGLRRERPAGRRDRELRRRGSDLDAADRGRGPGHGASRVRLHVPALGYRRDVVCLQPDSLRGSDPVAGGPRLPLLAGVRA